MDGLRGFRRSAMRRLLALIRRRRLDDELREELTLHIELRRQALVEEGLDPREADYEARRRFGNVTAIREETRDMWGFPAAEALAQDLRYGARMLRRTPLFAAVAVMSLAIGIGSSVAVFSVADAVLFRPLPVRAPEEVTGLRFSARLGRATKDSLPISLSTFQQLARATDFAELAGFQPSGPIPIATPALTHGYTARIELVTDTYFSMLGIAPAAGRLIGADDVRTGAAPVAVLSHRLWSSLFNRDAAVVGRTISVAGSHVTVVGVAAAGFGGPMIERPAEMFVPVTLAALVESLPAGAEPTVQVLARIPRDLNAGVAAERLTGIYAPLAKLAPKGGPSPDFEFKVLLQPASHGVSDSRPQMERPLVLVLGLVGILLMISCANVGNLLLSRFASREGEFAIRLAIGASSRRVMQHVLVESLLVAALSAAAGLALARSFAPLLVHLIHSPSGPLALDLPLDWRLILFTTVVSVGSALLIGATSAWRLLGLNASSALRSDRRAVVPARGRFARFLLVAQVACALLLLVGAASMLRTVDNLWKVDPGFRAEGAVLLNANAAHVSDTRGLPRYLEELRERLASAPGVASASMVQVPLMGTARTTGTVDVSGFTPASDHDRWSRVFQVGADFVESAGMRLLRGRAVNRTDSAGTERVAVVNESFAKFYFGTADPIGRVINGDIRIIGVVADTRNDSLRAPPERAMYQPFAQVRARNRMTFVVRTAFGAALSDVMASVSSTARSHDPGLRFEIVTLTDVVAKSVARERFLATLAGTLSALALLLACAGLYAVVAYAVAERRSEIGIRIALGARTKDVVGLVLRQPALVTLGGIALGLPGAYLVTHAIGSLLFGVAPFDAATVGVAAAILLAVALLAGLLPAWRAASIDPQESLRCG